MHCQLQACSAGHRDGRCIYHGRNIAFPAYVGQINGEAVAEVNHGAGNFLLPQPAPNIQPGHRIEMPAADGPRHFVPGIKALQRSRGTAQLSCNKNSVTRPRSVAQHCGSGWRLPQQHNVGNDLVRTGGISPGQRDLELARKREQAAHKTIHPLLGQ